MKQEQIRREFAVMNNAYRLYSFEYFLDSMEKLELDAVDLWGGVQHFDPYAAGAAYIRRFKTKLVSRGIRIAAYTPEILGYPYNLADRSKEIRQASLDYCLKNIRIAAELEAPVMLVSPGFGMWDCSYREAYSRAAGSLRTLAEAAEACGIHLALEHLTPQSSNLLTSVDAVCRMIEAADRPSLGAALDLGQMSVFGETAGTYFDRLGGKIQIVHMMDGSPGGHLAFGDGILPLQKYYEEIKERGYKGTITLEINDSRYGETPHEALRKCLAALHDW